MGARMVLGGAARVNEGGVAETELSSFARDLDDEMGFALGEQREEHTNGQ